LRCLTNRGKNTFEIKDPPARKSPGRVSLDHQVHQRGPLAKSSDIAQPTARTFTRVSKNKASKKKIPVTLAQQPTRIQTPHYNTENAQAIASCRRLTSLVGPSKGHEEVLAWPRLWEMWTIWCL
jgi:hypothetical protein